MVALKLHDTRFHLHTSPRITTCLVNSETTRTKGTKDPPHDYCIHQFGNKSLITHDDCLGQLYWFFYCDILNRFVVFFPRMKYVIHKIIGSYGGILISTPWKKFHSNSAVSCHLNCTPRIPAITSRASISRRETSENLEAALLRDRYDERSRVNYGGVGGEGNARPGNRIDNLEKYILGSQRSILISDERKVISRARLYGPRGTCYAPSDKVWRKNYCWRDGTTIDDGEIISVCAFCVFSFPWKRRRKHSPG